MATHIERKYVVVLLLLQLLVAAASCSGANNSAAADGQHVADHPSSTASQYLYGQQQQQVLVAASCTPKPIPQGSAYWGHVGALLAYLVQETPYTDRLSLKTRYGGGDAPAFGLATCSTSTSPSDCQSCLETLSSDIWRICNSALAARVQYGNCSLAYANYSF